MKIGKRGACPSKKSHEFHGDTATLAINQIGSGLSTSPHNADGPNAGIATSRSRTSASGTTSSPRNAYSASTSGSFLCTKSLIEAITSDPGFAGGEYESNEQEVWRAFEFESKEAFLEGDPNDLLCTAWKWHRGDVTRHIGGDLDAALGRITCSTNIGGHLGLFAATPTYMPKVDRHLRELFDSP